MNARQHVTVFYLIFDPIIARWGLPLAPEPAPFLNSTTAGACPGLAAGSSETPTSPTSHPVPVVMCRRASGNKQTVPDPAPHPTPPVDDAIALEPGNAPEATQPGVLPGQPTADSIALPDPLPLEIVIRQQSRRLGEAGGRTPAQRVERWWLAGCTLAPWYFGHRSQPPEMPSEIIRRRTWAIVRPGEPVEWSKRRGVVDRREREVRRIDHVVLGFASLAELTAFQGGLGGPNFAPLIELRGSA